MTIPGMRIRPLLVHALLISVSGFVLIPFLWMIAASMKSNAEILGGSLSLLPQLGWAGWDNYQRALTTVPLLRFMANGAIVCALIIACQLATAIPCAYALAKLRLPGRGLLFGAVLLALMIPPQVPALPLYILCYHLGLINSYAALVLPFATSAFAVFLLRQFFRGIPDDIIQAARLDGMTEAEVLWRVVVPSARSAIVAFSIFSAVSHWNDLFWPMIVISDLALAPPSLGIVLFRNEEAGVDFAALMAAAVVVTLPLVLFFMFAQRQFVEGISLNSRRI